MFKHKNESMKTAILIFLVITSFIQIGIHWSQQDQGFPINFITTFFETSGEVPSMDVDDLKAGYFTPESMNVIISRTASLWRLEQKDTYFKSIWKDIKENYLPVIIKQRPDKILPKDQWLTIISERSIRIDFSVNWPNDIICWLVDTNARDNRGFNSILSIAILPQKNVNEAVNTVYIYDGNQVYQYQVNIKETYLSKSFYKELAEKLDNQSRPKLDILTNKFTIFESEDDILISLSNQWSSTYSTIKIEIPSAIYLELSNIESVQKSILLNQKDSLMAKYNEMEGHALFTDTENLYTLYDNGILEYKYLPTDSNDAGTASSAFSEALQFIELRRVLLGDAELVLTFIEKENNYYKMQFDYSYNGVPVYFTGSSKSDGINPPLEIKANGERVLESKWVIRSFTEIEKPKKYNLFFYNLIEMQIPLLYPEIIDKNIREKLYFQRIEPGYNFGLNDQGDLPITPNWIISTESKDYYIPLLSEED